MTDTQEKTGPTGLADAATQGLDDVQEQDGAAGPAQGMFEGTDYTKITFLGVNYQSLELSPKIGDEMTFLVRGRIKEVGDKQMANGFTQHFGKVDVSAVVPYDGEVPADDQK